jgi:hypothetical protein
MPPTAGDWHAAQLKTHGSPQSLAAAGKTWWTLLETLELTNMCAPSRLSGRFRLFAQKRS